ncbi:N-6 DNA methylase [Capnocytophaga sp. ARDL2]|uniref:N-6 DNA methylase n=1 Tax=Capnocytophaga sp. ARDL2 TaxID=3238809 RepID=UPI003557A1FA
MKSRIKTTIGIVEHKDISKFKTQKQKNSAIQQGLEVAEVLEAKILIVTDTKETIWINALNGEEITDEKGRIVKENFDKNNADLAILIEKIYDSLDKENSQIREPRLKDPTRLAKSIWQDLWMAAGATPENCLYSFVELFIFKYLSDLGILKNHLSYANLMQIYNESSDAEETLSYYAGTIRKEIKKLFKPSKKDNTTIINGTIFVSKDEEAVKGYGTVFIKILKKFGDEKEGGGELKNIDRDFKSKLFETFLKESISKKNWGQYFTPLRVVRAIAKMAQNEIKPNITLCDPACGVGKFLLEPLLVDNDLDDFFVVKNGKLESKIKLIGIDKGFDKEEQKTIILAKANMLIYLSDLIRKNGGITEQFSELFNETFELKTKNILGTLRDVQYENKIDLILTNPPYVTTGSSNLKDEISKVDELKKFYTVNGIGVEGLFMEWIIRSLKPDGKAFVVVPDGIFNRQGDKNLRQFILDECIIDGIISLPLKTFFTTPKKTYIFAITKKMNKTERQTTPVFTYLVSEIGESRDTYRFEIEQDDLKNAVDYYNLFKGNKLGFAKINNDKRCKIQPIEEFKPENYWSIDRWWTKEEQIELGIVEEGKIFKIEEFAELVSDISETMKDYSGLLREVSQKKKIVNNFREIALSNERYFSLFIGKRLLKKDLIKISGNIPIYSANVKTPISYHTESNISDFANNFVLWGIDGDFEFNFIPKNTPFVSTDHCGAIRILEDSILPEYLMIQLDKVKHKYGFDRGLRSSLKNMKTVSIEIPFDEKDNIDIEKQREIIEKYEYIASLKSKITEYQKQIEDLNVGVGEEYPTKLKTINEIFDLKVKTNTSKFTKAFIEENKGDIPVYSASKDFESVDYGYVKDNLQGIKYFENCLTWNIDGSIGKAHFREGRFSLSEKVIPLILKEEVKDYLDIFFLKYAIESEFSKHSFGYTNKAGKSKIQHIKISIPINSKGEFDLEKQKEIAEKHRKMENIKRSISEELEKISGVEMDYE